MTIARKYLIDYSKTCYYHCMSRCVRQGFNLKRNSFSTTNRHDWIEKRLLFLANVFAIDLLAFAIMDNHTHTVLRADIAFADALDSSEVLLRWSKLGRIPIHCQLYLDPTLRVQLTEVELLLVAEDVEKYRARLKCISSFMSHFNSYIARRANKEDKVKGHFWEGRFKSQALLDAEAVLSCMAYVDLNPIRAKKCSAIENAKYTSLYKRIIASTEPRKTVMQPLLKNCEKPLTPMPFILTLHEYLDFLQSSVNQEQFGYRIEKQIDKKNWIAVPNHFDEDCLSISKESELASNFERQARIYSSIDISWKKAIGQMILERLRDNLYHCDKKPHPI